MIDDRKSYIRTNYGGAIFFPIIALVGIGVMMVYSSSSVISIDKYGSSYYYLRNHIFTVALSLFTLIFLSRVRYTLYKERLFIIGLLLAAIGMLGLVFVPGVGVTAGGAKRWIRLWPTTFQPSEFVKLAVLIFMSHYIYKNAYRMNTLIYGIVVPLFIMGVFQAILLMQPDFGAAMSLAFITVSLLYVGGARIGYLGGLFVLFLPMIATLLIIAPYRMARIVAFIDPWQDPLGKGYQLIQSFIAFGNGGLTGLGLGESKQKLFFLPESHTDFIFSIIGEEFGLLGASLAILLFVWLLYKGWQLAVNQKDPFAYYLAMGLTVMMCFQALINFCVTTGLLPTKGLPLPFISYGGSALLINMAAAGILLNIARSGKTHLSDEQSTDKPCDLRRSCAKTFSDKYHKLKQLAKDGD